jgi:RNase P subunit RPR2
MRQNTMAKKKDKSLALKQVKEFIALAKKDKVRCTRYTDIAHRIALKNQLKIPSEIKRQLCKHCDCLLMPGVNCRVRLANGLLIYYCSSCRRYTKFNIRRKVRTSQS